MCSSYEAKHKAENWVCTQGYGEEGLTGRRRAVFSSAGAYAWAHV